MPLLTGLAVLAIAPSTAAAPQRDRVPGPPDRQDAWTARLVAPVPVLTRPVHGHVIVRQSDFGGWNGGPVDLLVLDSRIGTDGQRWLRVLLPVRPNGSSGWIPADSAQLGTTNWRIEISTERRTVTVLEHGVRLRTYEAVVGAIRTPTPHGRFAIYERVRMSDPNGFYGPWALHLTALSNVLARYDGGPGRVAIHGRGGASLRDQLGTARSHGCIRLANAAVRFVAAHVPDGSPVVIS